MPIVNLEFRAVIALTVLFSALWSCFNNLYTISRGGIGRESSSVAVRKKKIFSFSILRFVFIQDTSIIFPVWPIGLIIFLAFSASNYSNSRVITEHPALLMVFYGFSFSKVTNRLIVRFVRSFLLFFR